MIILRSFFHQQIFISFLSDAKLPKVYDWFLGLIIYVKYLRSYFQKNIKGGPEKSEILCVDQLARAEKKSKKMRFSLRPPSWGKYRPNISLSCIVRKYLQSVLRATFNWSSKFHSYPSSNLLELKLILL